MTLQSKRCPCCGYNTFIGKEHGQYDICPVCFWEDDPFQSSDPDLEEGANAFSLRQAQANFLEFGACEKDLLRYVRQPHPDEL